MAINHGSPTDHAPRHRKHPARAIHCLLLAALSAPSLGCAGQGKNEVIVMGMIHGEHRTSALYGIVQIEDIVRRADPDFILCEIPPGRLAPALKEYRETSKITEPRVRVFPEYVQAIIPMMNQMKFELVPCAGWTKAMADDRRTKMKLYETSRPNDYLEMQQVEESADKQHKLEGLSGDPRGIHTQRYDEIVKQGLEPYNRLFNDDLGAGGWDNINAAHYRLIAKALDAHRDEGKRFLITFGAWHKYWFLEKLRERKDIKLRNLREFLPPTSVEQPSAEYP